MLTYPTRKEMLKALVAPGSTFAELGVFAGDLAVWIEKELRPAKFWAVDCYLGPVGGSGDQDGFNVEHYEQDILAWYAGQRTQLTRMTSGDFFKTLRDGELDAVYIDADHSYEGVKADLEAARHKVRDGGWIFGHDWYRGPKGNPAVDCNCERAVKEFCEKYGLEVGAKGEDGQVSFGIRNVKKSVHIVSFSDRPSLSSATWHYARKYAERHGYDFTSFIRRFCADRHQSWNKIPAVLQIMQDCSAEYVVWLDDDVLITDLSKSLYDFIDSSGFRESNALVLVCEDVPGERSTLFNMGVAVFKKGEKTEQLLKTIWTLGDKMPLQTKEFSYEQEVFNWYYKFAGRQDIMILPHGTLQSIARPGGPWRPGDFAAHVTAGELPRRLQILRLLISHGGCAAE